MTKTSIRVFITQLLLGIFISSFLGAQQTQFQKYYSTVTEYQQLSLSNVDTSYVIAASIGTMEGLDFSVVKTDAAGRMRWSKTYTSLGDDYLSSIAITNIGDIFLGGYKLNTAGDFDFSLMKLNALGEKQWYKTYATAAPDISVYVGATASGDVFLTGNIDSDIQKHIWVIKIDGSSGDVSWNKTFGSAIGGQNNMNLLAATITNDGGIAVLGVDNAHNYFMQLDADGNKLLTKAYDAITFLEEAAILKQTTDGGFIFCGKSKDCNDEICSYIFAFMKLDQQGNVSWSKSVARSVSKGIKYQGNGTDAVELPDGGYAFIGQLTNFNEIQSSKLVVIKTNALGTVLWTNGYGQKDSYGEHAGIEIASDGGLLLLGTENSRALLIKTALDGNSPCYTRLLNPVFTEDSISESSSPTFPELTEPYIVGTPLCTESAIQIKDSVICETILGIEVNQNDRKFLLYPNPFKDALVLEGLNKNQVTDALEFNIYNMLGEKVLTHILAGEGQQIVISRGSLPNGIYFYDIRNEGTLIDKGKIIAQ